MSKHYDCIFIGTGAGNIILEAALENNLKCAQIEKGRFGGTCLNRGCIPTKVMTTAADRIFEIKEAEKLGIEVKDFTFNWRTVKERVDSRLAHSPALREFYLEQDNLDVYEGRGKFVDDHTVVVEYNNGGLSEELTADHIYIGAGGRTKIPPMEGIEEVEFLTTESFFDGKFPEEMYESLIVVGGGAIGCEYAHIFDAFGCKVHLVQHNVRLVPKADRELSEALLRGFNRRGIDVHLNKETPKISQDEKGIHLTVEDRETGLKEIISAQHILIAPGIRPNSDTLALENTHIEVDARGWIRTNEYLETTVAGVYAFGDINGRAQLRHKANYEADILAHNLLEQNPHKWRWARYDVVPMVVFTNPELAFVGLSEEAARKQGYEVSIARNAYCDTAKGFALGYDEGSRENAFAKLIIDRKTNRMLGFQAVGTYSSTLIQPFVNLLGAGDDEAQVINEDIASPTVAKLRKTERKIYRSPQDAQTVRETMVAHPSLQEIGIWTYYHRDESLEPEMELE